jgi:acylpyruvate hydrolase
MRLLRFDTPSGPHLGWLQGDTVLDLSEGAPVVTDVHQWLALGPQEQYTLRQQAKSQAARPLAELVLRRPLARPGKLVCLGLNYRDHAAEGGNVAPEYPAFFLRGSTSLQDPGAPLLRPRCSDKLDFEAELAVVIGRTARGCTLDDALACVGGYSIFNDGTLRDYQRRSTQWTIGKNFDATGPLGPWVVTPDELPVGASGLRIQSRLNGQVMQDANTQLMITSVAQAIVHLSEVMTLEVGDVIAMGTPAGVGYARKPPVFMRHGDTIEIEIEGIGILSNTVEDEQ